MPPAIDNLTDASIPLCVDLDGTLIRSDVLWESLILLLKRNPFYLLALPFWLLGGRAAMKKEIAGRTQLDPSSLPYHQPFLEYLKLERSRGRTLVLATAADERLAQIVAKHICLFDDVVASNGKTNMRGKNKGNILATRFGRKRFDYAGNSTVDLPVWREARQALVVNAGERLAQRARSLSTVSHVFNEPESIARDIILELRPHQWLKNIIIFVPLLTSHKLGEPRLMLNAVVAFIAFSLCASGVYVVNDLCDLSSDRHHATKNKRPFASGRLPLQFGLFMVPILLGLSLALAFYISREFVAVLALYWVVTTSYSLRLKQIALTDVFVLAGLYTMRLIAGHAATGIQYSFWLLAFSIFIFLNLALVKRFTELRYLRQQSKHDAKGRGYTTSDLELVAMLGVASGFMAVLVMALYVHSEEVTILYRHAIVLLLLCPMLLYWISRVWLISHRGQMHEDPIVFALTDKVSWMIGALTLITLWLATDHHHWLS